MAVNGVDPMRFLYTTDHFERVVMMKLATEADRQHRIDQRNQAVLIAEQVGKMLGG